MIIHMATPRMARRNMFSLVSEPQQWQHWFKQRVRRIRWGMKNFGSCGVSTEATSSNTASAATVMSLTIRNPNTERDWSSMKIKA